MSKLRKGVTTASRLKTIYVLLYLLFFISGTIICYHNYVGYDEAYSMCLIRHSYTDIIRITAQDVHPPLYYLLLKTWMLPFGESVPAARMFSLLIYACFVSLGPVMVHRLLSREAGFLFSFFAVTLPACQSYLYSEIRMYGLAALLVTACALYAISIAKQGTSSSYKQWLGIFLTGILSAYTQYYALVAVVFIYIALFVEIWHNKHLSKMGKPLFICASLSCLLYIPWVSVLLHQLATVSESYWIGPFTLHTYLSFIAFPFYCSIHVGASFLYILFFTSLVVLMYRSRILAFWKHKKAGIVTRSSQNSCRIVLLCLMPYVAVILAGCTVSLLVRPLFSARYIKCILGLLILSISVAIERSNRTTLKRILILFCAVFAFTNFSTICYKNAKNNRTTAAYIRFLDTIKEYPVFAAEQSHIMGIHAFYAKNSTEYIPSIQFTPDLNAFSSVLHPISKEDSITLSSVWVVSESDFRTLSENGFLNRTISEKSAEFMFSDQTETFSIQYLHVLLQE